MLTTIENLQSSKKYHFSLESNWAFVASNLANLKNKKMPKMVAWTSIWTFISTEEFTSSHSSRSLRDKNHIFVHHPASKGEKMLKADFFATDFWPRKSESCVKHTGKFAHLLSRNLASKMAPTRDWTSTEIFFGKIVVARKIPFFMVE